MTTSHGPSYYFTVEDLSATPNIAQRYSRRGYWLPPRRYGSNRKTRAGCVFHKSGMHTATQTLRNPERFLDQLVTYQSYSIYHARGVLWSVNYDASKQQVGDGTPDRHGESQESASSSDEDDEDELSYDDWKELSFSHSEQSGYLLSIGGRRLPQSRLIRRREDQDWAQYFITDRYQSETTTSHANEGGLVGDVALLIGLVAMSMSPSKWITYIPQTMVASENGAGQWQVSPAQLEAISRGTRWFDQKGIVVTVYLDPINTSSAELEQYASGARGPILP